MQKFVFLAPRQGKLLQFKSVPTKKNTLYVALGEKVSLLRFISSINFQRKLMQRHIFIFCTTVTGTNLTTNRPINHCLLQLSVYELSPSNSLLIHKYVRKSFAP